MDGRYSRRRWSWCRWGVLALGGTVLLPTSPVRSAGAGVPEPVIWVEEDWRLVLNDPDDGIASPQFHTVMSPLGHLESNYAQVLWNYRETTGFQAGGVQLQSYDDDSLLRIRSVEQRLLSTTAETITWTQGLWTDGVTLSFYVDNGLSTSWGAFGRDMRIDENATIPNLNGYDPQVSADSAYVTFGANRVDQLVITEVRYYGLSGLLHVDTTPKVVYEYDGN